MPRAIFIQYLLPTKIDDMIALLGQCTPENMTALKKCLFLGDTPVESMGLAFECFLDAIAYPIQSYRITPQSKLELLIQIKRLYPNLERADHEKLRAILMRMDPSREIPVGLDALQPHQDFPLSEQYQTSLLGGIQGEYKVKGTLEIVKAPLDARWKSLLEHCNLGLNPSDVTLAETYQAILNLLYLESVRVRKSWESVQIDRASGLTFNEYYSLSESVVRFSSEFEVATCPDWNDESEDDFAFAVQRRELLLRLSSLLSKSEKKQQRELFELYNGLRDYSKGSENPRIRYGLACLRKELAYHKVTAHRLQFSRFDDEYRSNSAIRAFAGAVIEDFFAPCNSVLLSISQQSLREDLQAQQEYRALQETNPQQIADVKAVCEIYQQMAPNQAELYSLVYQQLKALVDKKKSKVGWMKYFKLFINIPDDQKILPERLPVVDLQEFDASIEMFKELERPPLQKWPIPAVTVAPAAKARPTNKPKIKMQPASAIEPQEAPDAIAQISDSEEGAAAGDGASVAAAADEASIASMRQHIALPVALAPLPARFKYAFRVLRWFNANAPLDRVRFPEYVEATEVHQKLMIAYHAFTCSVDSFVIRLALEMIWNNPKTGLKDTRYILPAEISLPALGKKSRGVITYCVDKRNGEVYHRFFSERSTEEVVRKISDQAFNEADFPSLESIADERSMGKADQRLPSPDPDEKIRRHPFWGTVTIENQRTKTQITLFPVKPEYQIR